MKNLFLNSYNSTLMFSVFQFEYIDNYGYTGKRYLSGYNVITVLLKFRAAFPTYEIIGFREV